MRILFMGTPDIAAECLKALYAAGHDICAVYTRRDKPVGRKQVLTAPPVKEVALAHGTPVFQPRTLRDGSEDENIRALAPELIVVVAYGCILPKSVLEMPRYGCINLHVSLLPKYRGGISPCADAVCVPKQPLLKLRRTVFPGVSFKADSKHADSYAGRPRKTEAAFRGRGELHFG